MDVCHCGREGESISTKPAMFLFMAYGRFIFFVSFFFFSFPRGASGSKLRKIEERYLVSSCSSWSILD